MGSGMHWSKPFFGRLAYCKLRVIASAKSSCEKATQGGKGRFSSHESVVERRCDALQQLRLSSQYFLRESKGLARAKVSIQVQQGQSASALRLDDKTGRWDRRCQTELGATRVLPEQARTYKKWQATHMRQ